MQHAAEHRRRKCSQQQLGSSPASRQIARAGWQPGLNVRSTATCGGDANVALLHDDTRLHHVGGLAGPRAPSPHYLLLPPSNGRRREASCGRAPGWNPAASMTLRPIVRRIVRAWAACGAAVVVFWAMEGQPAAPARYRSHWREAAPATCDLRPAMLSRTLPITARRSAFFPRPALT